MTSKVQIAKLVFPVSKKYTIIGEKKGLGFKRQGESEIVTSTIVPSKTGRMLLNRPSGVIVST